MTPYLFALVFFAGAIGGLVRWPLLALGTYVLSYYANPPSRWWGVLLPDLRWAFTAAVCAVITAFMYKPKHVVSNKPWYQDGIVYCLLAFVLWMWIQTPWALAHDDHVHGVIIMSKYFIVMYVMIKLLDSPDAIDFMFVIHILGCAYFGILARELGSGGERLDGVGGPDINEANALGMQLATAAVFSIVQMLSGPLWKRGLVFLCLPFILNGMVLTQSRGSFLALIAGGCALFFLAPKGKQRRWIGLMGAGGAVLFLALASASFWTRMQTIEVRQGEQREKSAESRIIIAQAQLKMFAAYPMGIGHRGTAALSRQYIPEEYLAHEAGVSDANRERSSHNTFLTILVEQGIIGAIIYSILLVIAFKRILSLRSKREADPTQARISLQAAGIGGAFVTVLVAGQFVDYLRNEIFVWLYALIIAASRVMESNKLQRIAPLENTPRKLTPAVR